MRRNLSAWLIGLSGAVGAGYWTLLSPHSQIMGSFPYRGNRSDQVIALTFDDGPNEPFTTQIGEFLASNAIRATFFQVGRCVERFPEATARLIQQGHVIGNHSYSHETMNCLAPGPQRQQTHATQQILQRVIGRTPALYRPPWLLRTPALRATLRSHGLRPVSGDFCHPLEVFQVSPLRIARRALAKAGPGAILIFHDGFNSHQADRSKTVQAVKIVVARLIRQGYLFVTVDELLDIPAYQDPAPAGRAAKAQPHRTRRGGSAGVGRLHLIAEQTGQGDVGPGRTPDAGIVDTATPDDRRRRPTRRHSAHAWWDDRREDQ